MVLTQFIPKAVLALVDTIYLMQGMRILGEADLQCFGLLDRKIMPISFINGHISLHLPHRKANFGPY